MLKTSAAPTRIRRARTFTHLCHHVPDGDLLLAGEVEDRGHVPAGDDESVAERQRGIVREDHSLIGLEEEVGDAG
jgi:hypothetical protein